MKKFRSCRYLAALSAALLASVAGCTATEQKPPETLKIPAEALTITSDKQMATSKMTLNEQIAWSVNDLAQRLGVPSDSIVVVNARMVTWRSGAVGCPEPGMSYADVLVPGASILLKQGEVLSSYHAAIGGTPFRCPLDRAELPVYGEGSDQI
jgi:hypothetical protein